jgi:hypothetical protein
MWGALASLGVGVLNYKSGADGAAATYRAGNRSAEELRLRAIARRSLMNRQARNLFKNYSSAEADYLNKKGDEKELMLMQLDKLVGTATAELGTSGVKLSEGTPKSLITQLKLEGAEARLRQDSEVRTTSQRMKTSYQSQRDEIKEQGRAEADSLDRASTDTRKAAHDQSEAAKAGAFASGISSVIQTSAAFGLTKADWGFGESDTTTPPATAGWDFNSKHTGYAGSMLTRRGSPATGAGYAQRANTRSVFRGGPQ